MYNMLCMYSIIYITKMPFNILPHIAHRQLLIILYKEIPVCVYRTFKGKKRSVQMNYTRSNNHAQDIYLCALFLRSSTIYYIYETLNTNNGIEAVAVPCAQASRNNTSKMFCAHPRALPFMFFYIF